MDKIKTTISAIVLGCAVATSGVKIVDSYENIREAEKKFALYESAAFYKPLHLKYSSQSNLLLEDKKEATEKFLGNLLISAIGLGAAGYIFYRTIHTEKNDKKK